MPRFRFTVRRMMGLVAISAALIGAGAMVRRHLRLSERAEFHARMGGGEGEESRSLDDLARAANDPQDAAEIRAVAAAHARHIHVEQKYRRMASYPWLPVAPDPTEPG